MQHDQLKLRIRNGAFWLLTHDYAWCQRWGVPYDEAKWLKHLSLYETLVDSLKALGGTEQECLQISDDLTVANMSTDMVLVYLCGMDVKSRLTSNRVAQIINLMQGGVHAN